VNCRRESDMGAALLSYLFQVKYSDFFPMIHIGTIPRPTTFVPHYHFLVFMDKVIPSLSSREFTNKSILDHRNILGKRERIARISLYSLERTWIGKS